MPIEVKLIFTVAIVILSFVIIFVSPEKIFPYKAGFWQGGKADPFKKLIFNKNGITRKYLKHGLIFWFCIFVAGIWFIL